ncbi:SusC/RagA family TonB-linked outer membrane protein [Paraflavitalea pollutisoli]|uniref:SusC/RagA family TonB-linked outer membrane protein n=1 Tax=Paraflavitalea pollutisoli TaxID=3034143 RepID=UPI0023EA8B1E|nr:SusC/RagA family TonB-linked outer membrane protein [Paraflavitalea sp. H1-2-19X]
MNLIALFWTAVLAVTASDGISQSTTTKALVVDNVPVTGRVLQDGKPVEGASVLLKPSGMGTSTNRSGVFLLPAVPTGSYLLQVSSIGYVNYERKVTVKQEPLNITCHLELLVKEQEEVVISTGYATRKPGELTGAEQKITGEELRRGITTVDVASLLKGRATGVYLSEQNAADPTSTGAQLFVRGQSSIAGVGIDQYNEFVMPALSYGPLIVLDGVIMPNQNLKELVTPAEIQDITILKDAAATSIYGSRAAGGVLVVTTKKGRVEKPRLSAEVKYGINSPNKGRLRFLNGPELYELQKQVFTQDYAINNASLAPSYPTLDSYLSDLLPTQQELDNSYDWSKYAFVTSRTVDATVSASGGNSATKYYLGAGYYHEQSTGVGTGLVRKSFRLNLQSQLTDKLNVQVGLHGIFDNGNRDPSGAGSLIAQLIPWANPYNADGSIRQKLDYTLAGEPSENDNPLFNRQYDHNTRQRQLFFGSARLEYRFTDWLSFSSINSANLNYSKNERYMDARTYSGGLVFWGSQGFLGTSTDNLQSYLSSNQLSFNKQAGNHSFRALAALEFGKTKVEDITVNVNHVRVGYPIISLARQIGDEYDFGIPATKAGNIEGGKDEKAVYSIFGDVGYTYKDRYTLSTSLRTDASSAFGRDKRYGTFWSGGAAWVLSKESFLQPVKWINNLKLRASYGTTGSQLGDNFLTRTLYDPGYIYSGQAGAIIGVLGNPALKWEVTKTWNAGVDMVLFNRLHATIDVYHRRSQDLLQKVMLPPLAGFPSQWQNIATVDNKGMELLVSYDPVVSKDFRWSVSFNITYNRNRIVQVANDSISQGYYSSERYFLYKGDDINTLKAVKYAGVDPATGMPRFEKLVFDNQGNKTGVEYVNSLAEVGASTDKRQFQTIGSFQPRFYGGFTNTLTYKKVTLSILLTYALKYVIRDDLAAEMQGRYLTVYNQLAFTKHQKIWTTPGQIDATEPSLYYNYEAEYSGSDKYMHDASHVSLRNVRISYELPLAVLRRIGSSACAVYFSADNLHTWYSNKIIGSGPEGPSVGQAQDFGGAGGTLAIPRRYVFGLQVSF